MKMSNSENKSCERKLTKPKKREEKGTHNGEIWKQQMNEPRERKENKRFEILLLVLLPQIIIMLVNRIRELRVEALELVLEMNYHLLFNNLRHEIRIIIIDFNLRHQHRMREATRI